MVLIMKKSRKQQCNQRNGDDAAQGGDESHLCDERWIATVFQAEHGAEAGYRHRYDYRIDVVNQIVDTTRLEQKVDAQRNHDKAKNRRNVYLRTSDNLPDGKFCHGRTDYHKSSRNRNIS